MASHSDHWETETCNQDSPEVNPLISNEDLSGSDQGDTRTLAPARYAELLSSFRVIAVLGSTGAGKSTFIQRATGSDKIIIGNTLRSCTKEVSVWPTVVNGIKVALIDTPGFDDTDRSDSEILEDVATWLAATFEQDVLLSGMIFLEPVNTSRVSGSEQRRIRILEKICGKHVFSNVIIASTMWNTVAIWPASRRNARLLMKERVNTTDFWGMMMIKGARYEEHTDTKASALRIIRMLLEDDPKPLQLQVELQGNGSQLSRTTAGRLVMDALDTNAARLAVKIQALKEEQEMSGVDLQDYLDELERNYQKLESEKARFRTWKKLSTGALTAATIAAQLTVAALMCNVM